MRRLVAAAVLTAAAAPGAAGAGRSDAGLCVGGPHCYQTIQAAVDAAAQGATIRISPGTYAGGLVVTKSLDLVGGSAERTVISGGGPIVTIGSSTTAPTVSLKGLTITGGLTRHDPQAPRCGPDVPRCGPGYADATALGGGIETFRGSTVTLASTIVAGNRAEPALSVPSVKAVCPGPAPCPASFGDAAGIDNWGTMLVVDSVVSDNHAAAVQSNGGGIVDEADASLTLRNSRVTGNSAAAAPPWGRFASGGGIFVAGGATLTVSNSVVDGNTASLVNSIPHPYPAQDGGTDMANAFSGGVQLADGATASFENSTLDGNAVSVTSPDGEPFGADAAVCACGDSSLTLSNSKLEDNTLTVDTLSSADVGPSGGILEADGAYAIANTQIDGNTITVRTPGGDAQAVGTVTFFSDGSRTGTIEASSISDNTVTAWAPLGLAAVQGAGLLNNGPLVVASSRIDRNRGVATGARGLAEGGGVWNGQYFGGPQSPLTLVATHVSNNALVVSPGLIARGGGIFTPGFPLTLQASVVSNNAPDDCVGC